MPLLYEVHNKTENYEAARHLQFWIYGHIVEASEPYEMLANLVQVSLGGGFVVNPIPIRWWRIDWGGRKIIFLAQSALFKCIFV